MKDGKFVYVGDEDGLSEYEGPATDLAGRFVMPGIIDSHVHVTMGAGYELIGEGGFGEIIHCASKKEALDFISDYIRKNPGKERYRFMLDKKHLQGDNITKEDLDLICPDG